MLNINFDASVRCNPGISISLIVCDYKGEFLARAMKFFESKLCPKKAEAWAFRCVTITMAELHQRCTL